MMRHVIRNATLVSLLPELSVAAGDLVIEDGLVVDVGAGVAAGEGLDRHGAMVLPGLCNAHTHLYSALAAGMPAPARAPTNFVEILQEVWWKLDRGLDDGSVYLSGLVGALEAARSGVTLLVDHHASPHAISGSLDQIAAGVSEVGLSGIYCYEATDRGGAARFEAGLAENVRFAKAAGPRAAGLIGGHASFTLSDESLRALGGAVAETGRPFHIHVAEDGADVADADPIERLATAGLLTPGAVLAHGVKLQAASIRRAMDAGCWLVHNARSNMNNAVGYAALAHKAERLAVGTDGIGSDVLSEVRVAFLKAQEAGVGDAWGLPLRLLQGSLRLAAQQLGRATGSLRVGVPADVVVTDYLPHTPLHTGNFSGHLLFGFDRSHVTEVYADGRLIWPSPLELPSIYARARDAAAALWERMRGLDEDG